MIYRFANEKFAGAGAGRSGVSGVLFLRVMSPPLMIQASAEARNKTKSLLQLCNLQTDAPNVEPFVSRMESLLDRFGAFPPDFPHFEESNLTLDEIAQFAKMLVGEQKEIEGYAEANKFHEVCVNFQFNDDIPGLPGMSSIPGIPASPFPNLSEANSMKAFQVRRAPPASFQRPVTISASSGTLPVIEGSAGVPPSLAAFPSRKPVDASKSPFAARMPVQFKRRSNASIPPVKPILEEDEAPMNTSIPLGAITEED